MGILVNGNGNPHVYAHQDSDLIAGIVGNQTSIIPVGDKFEANQEDANTIALSSGVIITKEGRRIQLDAGTIDEFIIPTGAQDVQSFYIIGYHLYEDGNSDQLCETFVRKMDSASDTIPESTFRSGATEVYVSLYRVTQDSLNITDIDLLLPYADSIAEVKRNGGNKNLAAIEDGSTASQPYVKGEFVIVGGQFCEVTSSISTNDAFIAYPLPNYNIKAGTVGEQITALNQNLTLNYADSSLPSSTTFNEFAQMVLEKLYPKTLNVWKDGVFGISVDNGVYKPSSSNTIQAFVVNGNVLERTSTSALGNVATLVTEEIDFSNFALVKVKTSKTADLNINVSGYNGSGYLAVTLNITNSNVMVANAKIVSAKANFDSYIISNLYTQETYQTSAGQYVFGVTEITIE